MSDETRRLAAAIQVQLWKLEVLIEREFARVNDRLDKVEERFDLALSLDLLNAEAVAAMLKGWSPAAVRAEPGP